MIDWNSITVLSIDNIYTVPSERGKNCHIERKQYALSFSYGGKISYYFQGKRHISDRDHAILLPPQSYDLRREETGEFPVINFTCTEDFDPRDFALVALRNPESYLRDYERMRVLWLSGTRQSRVMGIFYDILGRLSEEERLGETPVLAPAMEYLGSHLSDPSLSNRELAERAHISEVYFRKLFKQAYGISPKQYVLDARIRHAKALLTENATTVTAVAEACGFSGVYHFCRAFKKATGQTPKEWGNS